MRNMQRWWVRERWREKGERKKDRERDERKRHDDTVICAEGERE